MRIFDTATATALASGAVELHALVWITGRNRATGLPESIGFWSGDDVAEFTIGGQARTYYGAGNALEVDPIILEAGYSARSQRLRLGALTDEVILALRGYDPKFAPVEIHRAVFDPVTVQLVAPPHAVFRGFVDDVSLPRPEVGGVEVADLALVSSAVDGTRGLTLRKSDEALQARWPGDGFRRYISVSAVVPVWWGELRVGQTNAIRGPLGGDNAPTLGSTSGIFGG